jgi:hypothetical protein
MNNRVFAEAKRAVSSRSSSRSGVSLAGVTLNIAPSRVHFETTNSISPVSIVCPCMHRQRSPTAAYAGIFVSASIRRSSSSVKLSF